MKNISIKNLCVSHDQYLTLNSINFEANKGEFVAIVGKSGSGKTTFLSAIAGLIPYTGLVSAPKNIGMVFQNYSVFPWLTVAQNIAFGLDVKDKKERQKIVTDNLILANLLDKRDIYPAELSGGQIQRIALARALAHNPEVLLMDEPYGALDAYTKEKMQQWLLNVWARNKRTVIFVTHDIEEAVFLADRILVLQPHGFTEEFAVPFSRPRNEDIRFTSKFNELRQKIYTALKQNPHREEGIL